MIVLSPKTRGTAVAVQFGEPAAVPAPAAVCQVILATPDASDAVPLMLIRADVVVITLPAG